MEQQLFARHTGDDDLFLADADFLFKQDVQPQPQQQPHNPFGSGAHTSTSNNMDDNSGFDHVDSLLLGFDLDASSFEQSSFDASVFASTGFNNHNNAHLSHHRDNQHSFDGSASPTTTDDMSGSEMSSPAPSYSDSPASSPVRLAPAPARQSHNTSTNANSNALPPAHNMTPAMASAMHAFAAANALPYALPVAYFPPSGMQQQLNSNHKRPFQPDVLPTATSTSTSPIAAAVATAVDSAMSDAKKSKREIRQMKNRESANKSRLRRKAQMSELSDEVAELTKTQHELENTIAALRAENKSLHDQNTFLRSLIAKPDGSSSSSSNSAADSIALLPPMQQQLGGIVPALTDVNASAMENGQSAPAQPIAATQPQTKKLRTSRATTLSAASLSLCASVFGVTLLSDYESSSGGATSHVRGASRVLHALPASVRDAGFSPAPPTSLLEALWDSLTASWTLLSSSELAFGIVLNVLSFVVIMGLYHAWQASSLSTSTASSTPLSSNRRSWSAKTQATAAGARRHGAGRTESKHRSVSSHDAATDGSKSPSSKTTNHTSAAPLARMRELL